MIENSSNALIENQEGGNKESEDNINFLAMDKKDFENIFNQLIENFDKFFSSKPVKKLSKEEKIDTIKDLQIYLVLFYRNLQNTIGDEKIK